VKLVVTVTPPGGADNAPIGVVAGVGVPGGIGIFLSPLPPPPHAANASAAAAISKFLERCVILMAALRRSIGATRRIGLADV
jgi:hypothetical protein